MAAPGKRDPPDSSLRPAPLPDSAFRILILGLGGLLPPLHRQGVNAVILGLGALISFWAFQGLPGIAMRRIPVRCRGCGGRSYFTGLGGWHSIYRGSSSDQVPESDRRAAPSLALCVAAVAAIGLAGSWLAYRWGGESQFTFGP